MITPKTCACGEAMQWREVRYPGMERNGPSGTYLCHHCDEPCAGVASTANCPLCRAIAIKR